MAPPSPNKRSTAATHFVAGLVGGTVPSALLHPLELVKIRLAASTPSLPPLVESSTGGVVYNYRGVWQSCASIYADAGLVGFYRGATANVVGNAIAWGTYFALYDWMKTRLASTLHIDVDELPAVAFFASGIASSCVVLTITNPVWMAKTRLCLQYGSPGEGFPDPERGRNIIIFRCVTDYLRQLDSRHYYSGLVDCLSKTYKADGWRGLYRGYMPGLVGTTHGALQIAIYDSVKRRYAHLPHRRNAENQHVGELSTVEYLAIASSTKMVSTAVTYPYQVIRTRLQDHNRQWRSVSDVVKTSWANEGVRAFYRGLLPCLLRVTPATALTFVIYEKLRYFLSDEFT